MASPNPMLVEQLCRACLPAAFEELAMHLRAGGLDPGELMRCTVLEDRRGRLHREHTSGCRLVVKDLGELLEARWCYCGDWRATDAGRLASRLLAASQAIGGDERREPYANWDQVLGAVRGRPDYSFIYPQLTEPFEVFCAEGRAAELRRARHSIEHLDRERLYRGFLYWNIPRTAPPAGLRVDGRDVTRWATERWAQLQAPQPRRHEPRVFKALDRWLAGRADHRETLVLTSMPERLAMLNEAHLVFWAFAEQVTPAVQAVRVPALVADVMVDVAARSFSRLLIAVGRDLDFDPPVLEAAALLWQDGGPAFSSFDACLAAARCL